MEVSGKRKKRKKQKIQEGKGTGSLATGSKTVFDASGRALDSLEVLQSAREVCCALYLGRSSAVDVGSRTYFLLFPIVCPSRSVFPRCQAMCVYTCVCRWCACMHATWVCHFLLVAVDLLDSQFVTHAHDVKVS